MKAGSSLSQQSRCIMLKYDDKIVLFKSHMLGKDNIHLSDCERLKNKILDLESTILNLGPANYLEAPQNSITTRHQYYNLIDMINEELDPVKEKIINNCKNIIGGNRFYVKMWANIFRNGEKIDKHTHHTKNIVENHIFKTNIFKTVCGNLFLYGDAESETIYYLNERTPILNKTGDFHFFAAIVEHETLPFNGNLRVGIAFDVYTEDFFTRFNMSTPTNLRLIG